MRFEKREPYSWLTSMSFFSPKKTLAFSFLCLIFGLIVFLVIPTFVLTPDFLAVVVFFGLAGLMVSVMLSSVCEWGSKSENGGIRWLGMAMISMTLLGVATVIYGQLFLGARRVMFFPTEDVLRPLSDDVLWLPGPAGGRVNDSQISGREFYSNGDFSAANWKAGEFLDQSGPTTVWVLEKAPRLVFPPPQAWTKTRLKWPRNKHGSALYYAIPVPLVPTSLDLSDDEIWSLIKHGLFQAPFAFFCMEAQKDSLLEEGVRKCFSEFKSDQGDSSRFAFRRHYPPFPLGPLKELDGLAQTSLFVAAGQPQPPAMVYWPADGSSESNALYDRLTRRLVLSEPVNVDALLSQITTLRVLYAVTLIIPCILLGCGAFCIQYKLVCGKSGRSVSVPATSSTRPRRRRPSHNSFSSGRLDDMIAASNKNKERRRRRRQSSRFLS